jgi:fatty acid desaturase
MEQGMLAAPLLWVYSREESIQSIEAGQRMATRPRLEGILMRNFQDAAYSTGGASKFAIPGTTNLRLAALYIFLNLFQFFVLPVYLFPRSMRWSLVLIPLAVFNNPLWALIHEAVHGQFSASPRLNSGLGRVLAIFFGAPFHVLRLTHLSHHKFNRSPLEKGTEIYDPKEVSRFKASLGYFIYILCGLYLLEVFSTVIFYLPQAVFHKVRQNLVDRGNIQEKWLAGKFIDDVLVREVRTDGLAIGLILGLSAFCYGEHWKLLAGMLMVRTFLISFLDNVYHYRTALNRTISGHNLWLPAVLAKFILNFNLHRVHHTHPTVPWTMLPEVFANYSERYDGSFFSAAMDQFCGPLSTSYLTDCAAVTKQPDLVKIS